MTWAKLDDQFYVGRKARRAGPAGREMYVAALCYSNAWLTDGVIDREVVPLLAAQVDVTKPAQVVARLVELGLWEPEGDGYRVHDWEEYNEPAEKIKKRRKEDRIRKASARNPAGIQPDNPPNLDGIPPSLVGVGLVSPENKEIESELEREVAAKVAAGERIHDQDAWKAWRRPRLEAEHELQRVTVLDQAQREGERLGKLYPDEPVEALVSDLRGKFRDEPLERAVTALRQVRHA